jgi:hypothetical protein
MDVHCSPYYAFNSLRPIRPLLQNLTPQIIYQQPWKLLNQSQLHLVLIIMQFIPTQTE